jgi:TRAP-type C4-dicarboxylate transport system substrate-binding protein
MHTHLKTMALVPILVMMFGFALTPTASAKVIELTINDHNPEVSGPSQALKHWAQETEKRCGGKLKINVIYGGALLKGNEVLRGVQSGVAAGGHYVLDRKDGFNLNAFITLPFMGYPSQKETGEIYKQMIKDYPELAAEYKDVTIIGLIMMPPTGVHTAKTKVVNPTDLKGLKLLGAEFSTVQAIGIAGATPVQMDIADMYMSLDRGLIDGIINHVPVAMVFRVLDLLHSHTFFGPGGINMTPMMLVMNTKALGDLPDDIREQVTSSGPIWEEMFYKMDLGMQKEGYDTCKKRGDAIYELTPEEIKAWYNLVKGPIHDKWIKVNASKGRPAQEIYDDLLKRIADKTM